jgi:hypothetical protein
MSLNLSSRILFELYMLLDFLLLASYPLDQIYNRSKSSDVHPNSLQTILGYFSEYINPADKVYVSIDYDTSKKVILCLIIYSFMVLAILLALIFTWNKKKLTISP